MIFFSPFLNIFSRSFSLKEICANRWMMLLWVCLWGLSWQMPSCIISRNNWKQQNKMPEVYKRHVDDTIRVMTGVETDFLTTLNNNHPSIDFTIELEENGRLLFLGMEVMKDGCSLKTQRCKRNRRTVGYCYTTTAT
mgnify:FL=1